MNNEVLYEILTKAFADIPSKFGKEEGVWKMEGYWSISNNLSPSQIHEFEKEMLPFSNGCFSIQVIIQLILRTEKISQYLKVSKHVPENLQDLVAQCFCPFNEGISYTQWDSKRNTHHWGIHHLEEFIVSYSKNSNSFSSYSRSQPYKMKFTSWESVISFMSLPLEERTEKITCTTTS